MLTAILENGRKICIGDGWERQQLIQLRDRTQFLCPLCREEVILKLGEKKIFHFAHLANSNCCYNQDRESDFHMNGKIQLYTWLKEQGITAELEYYDCRIKQRADIAFNLGGRDYVLEYQCTTISETIFNKRNNGYKSVGYIPIWILGANQWNRKNSYLSSFSPFQYLFLRQNNSNMWYIPFYCSNSKMFILQQDILPITINKAFSKQAIKNLSNVAISQILQPEDCYFDFSRYWIKELSRYKEQLIRYSNRSTFLTTIYKNHLHLSLLPPFIGLPVRHSPYLTTPPLIWQTYLFIDVLYKWPRNTPIRTHDFLKAFKLRLIQKELLRRNILFSNGDNLLDSVILEYIELLIKTNILNMLNASTFKLTTDIQIPKTLSEQLEIQNNYYQEYKDIIFPKALFTRKV